MKNYIVRRYISEDYAIWNDFISSAKNATFLFHRDFMEYHINRFEDFSLMVFQDDKLVSVIPANKLDSMVYSHQGLTYGGFVFHEKIKMIVVKYILDDVILFLKQQRITSLIIKDIVSIYTKEPTYEVGCLVIQKGGNLYRRDMNLALNLKDLNRISKSKQKHYKKNLDRGIEIIQETIFNNFWQNVLQPRLKEKFGAKPVHSINEITYLSQKFPDKIEQYNAYFEGEIVAGLTIFKFDNVIKSQYGATTCKGEKIRALDFLYFKLIEKYKDEFSFFDMGTISENDGKDFNEGLLNQKEELGCCVFNQDHYKLEIND